MKEDVQKDKTITIRTIIIAVGMLLLRWRFL